MGGAFIAVADDGTAVGFNPAGLAQLRRTELAVVGFNNKLASTVSFPVPRTRSRTPASTEPWTSWAWRSRSRSQAAT